MELDWDKSFNPAYGFITMPPKTYVYYRGYDTSYPAISNRPAYFGSLSTATSYAKGAGRTLSAFTNIKPLTLIDVRFMKDILREIFQTHITSHMINNNSHLSVVLSFGICSLFHQIKLAYKRFPTLHNSSAFKSLFASYFESDIEQSGVRIAETKNDSYTMAFLQTLFSGYIDGFISPPMVSPFHIEKSHNIMNAEMIILNPEYSGIVRFSSMPKISKVVSMSQFYQNSLGDMISVGNPVVDYGMYIQVGGGESSISLPSVELINSNIDTDPAIKAAWEEGCKAGMEWKMLTGFFERPVPHVKVAPWDIPGINDSDLILPKPVSLDDLIKKQRKQTRKKHRAQN